MRPIYCLVTIILPVLVLSQKCPTFQSVIPLRPSATSKNFSFAIFAQGMYYLMDNNDQSRKQLSPSGVLPKGWEGCRLITLVDRSDCNQSDYYLIAIQSFRLSESTIHVNYTTLDLMNWDQSTKWAEPKSISDHPIFSNDPFVKVFTQLKLDFMIEDYIHMIFYWHQKKTLFVVIYPSQKVLETPIRSSSLRYYSIDTKNGCEQNYSLSKTESLVEALNPLVDLDLCFFSQIVSDSILYCIGGQSFQANTVVQTFENGSLRTQNIGSPEEMPTIDRLKIFSRICVPKERKSSAFGMSDRIRVQIDDITREDMGSKSVPEKDERPDIILKEEAPIQELTLVQTMPSNREEVSSLSNSESGDSSSTTFIIILICLAIFVLIMIGILIIAARRQQQIAKM